MGNWLTPSGRWSEYGGCSSSFVARHVEACQMAVRLRVANRRATRTCWEAVCTGTGSACSISLVCPQSWRATFKGSSQSPSTILARCQCKARWWLQQSGTTNSPLTFAAQRACLGRVGECSSTAEAGLLGTLTKRTVPIHELCPCRRLNVNADAGCRARRSIGVAPAAAVLMRARRGSNPRSIRGSI